MSCTTRCARLGVDQDKAMAAARAGAMKPVTSNPVASAELEVCGAKLWLVYITVIVALVLFPVLAKLL
jgi:hypothetical protein